MKSRLLLCLFAFAVAGCDDDRVGFDGSVPADASGDTDAGGGTDSGASDGGAPADASSPEGLSIAFDYRYDTAGFFTDPARRAALEAAAAVWSSTLMDDFEDIPAGTSIRTRDPENPTVEATNFPTEVAIDDVLIFVGCVSFEGGLAQSNSTAGLSSVTDFELAGRLNDRYQGADFEPWTGWIAFNCDSPWFFDATPDTDGDIPSSANDFHSTAMHEIGHVLGFGTSNAFMALTSAGTFVGPAAAEANGGPVPLTSSGTHFQSSVVSDGQVTLMDVSRTVGTRTPPTRLDRAAMADIGYSL